MLVSVLVHLFGYHCILVLLSGMRVNDTSPLVTWQNGQGIIAEVKFMWPIHMIMMYEACSNYVQSEMST